MTECGEIFTWNFIAVMRSSMTAIHSWNEQAMKQTREYPTRPIIGVGAVIWRGDYFLMVRQSTPPRGGLWGLPGGAQELGETIQEALIREVKEETGLDVTIGPLIDVINAIMGDEEERVRFHYTLLDYRCDWVNGEARPDSDVEEVRWTRLDELEALPMWAETKRIIEKSASLS
jgi:ADP-ribose pyrophosphatase YjhB (NUDIX family)